MADLNIRNVPDELLAQLKKAAVDRGVTLREFVISELSGGVHSLQVFNVPRSPGEPKLEDYFGIERSQPAAIIRHVKPVNRTPAEKKQLAAAVEKLMAGRPSRKDVGHGTICLCRECEAKRR